MYRPLDVDTLLGDPSLAKKDLGWEPKISCKMLCQEMALSDFEKVKSDQGPN